MQLKKEHFSNYARLELIKFMALVIACCYVFNPLHQQISSIFHEVSHVLEMPNTVMEHAPFSYEDDTHQSHNHRSTDSTHEHKIIKILDTIFDGPDSNNSPEDTLLTDFKFDKHITTNNFLFNILPSVDSQENFKTVDGNLKLGYYFILEEPPRYANSPFSI
ncbi:hypothetical protein [Zobellia roscoffensis]|uniref:hypothetical protein n=1 Tax=Zobellia roscoffensis TaxID=2779508 RepID=UPI00188C9D20|nr:hypothetical protein [Zobellia roscoffensis]